MIDGTERADCSHHTDQTRLSGYWLFRISQQIIHTHYLVGGHSLSLNCVFISSSIGESQGTI